MGQLTRAELLDPLRYPADGTTEEQLRHALCWALEGWSQALHNLPAPATAVFSYAEATLRREGVTPLLREECEKRGLPVSLAALLRHIDGNRKATLGAKDFSIGILQRATRGRDRLRAALAGYEAQVGAERSIGEQLSALPVGVVERIDTLAAAARAVVHPPDEGEEVVEEPRWAGPRRMGLDPLSPVSLTGLTWPS